MHANQVSVKPAPIGVFDSGLGGLTVARQIRHSLPGESIVYLGDTARVPYGTRSPETVLRYARGCAGLLCQVGIKALVVACNTASAVALEFLQAELEIPVIGVIRPGAAAAVAAVKRRGDASGKGLTIGVLGTASTVASGAYPREVARLDPRIPVVAEPAPLLVPLVEEGWLEGDVPRLAAERYVAPILELGARVLVLGCTHYPLLGDLIQQSAQKLSGEDVVIVDSAEATAQALREELVEAGLASPLQQPAGLRLLVTDLPRNFDVLAARFLGEQTPRAELVDIAPALLAGR